MNDGVNGWTDEFFCNFTKVLEKQVPLVFNSGDHGWKKLIMVHHWPTTVCKVSFSASTGPFGPVKPGEELSYVPVSAPSTSG